MRSIESTEEGWAGLQGVRETRMRVFEPPLADLLDPIEESDRRGGLSLTDHALAFVARRERVKEVVTEDAEFRRLGLTPMFALVT